jgi:Tfp pilus assembly protein PilV
MNAKTLPFAGFRAQCNPRAGFSLLEVTVAMAFTTLALMGIGALFTLNQRSYETSREIALVTHSFRKMAEKIRSTPFDKIPAKYHTLPFEVEEIGGQGIVEILTSESTQESTANFSAVDSAPITSVPITSTAIDDSSFDPSCFDSVSDKLIAVRLNVRWENTAGPQSKSLVFFISEE